MKSWYALYVTARHEKKVARKLLEKGIETYAPVMRRVRQWSDRRKLVEFPLINGYVFVSLEPLQMDQPRFVPGVVNYVRFEGKPAVIRPVEIEALKYFEEHGYELEEMRGEQLRIGDRVKFNLADFKGFTAVVGEFIGDSFAVITFEGMATDFKLKAPIGALRKNT